MRLSIKIQITWLNNNLLGHCDNAGLGLGLGSGSRLGSRLGLGLGLILGS